MIVTLYRGAQNPVPASADDLTWPELCSELRRLAQVESHAPDTANAEEQKKQLWAWAPHELEPGATRSAKAVRAVTAIAIDVDNKPPKGMADPPPPVAPGVVAARLRKLGLAGFVYESPSSTEKAPRFRVVMPVRKAFDPSQSKAVRLAVAELVGLRPGHGPEGAVEAAKLFFAGRLRGTSKRRTWDVPGKPIDVAKLPAPALSWKPRERTTEGKAAKERTGPLPPATAGIAAALGDWQLQDGRKWEICGAVGGLLRRLGYSAAQCEAEIRAWLPGDDDHVDVAAGVKWALGAWGKQPTEVSGAETLAGIVGAKHAAIVETAARAGSSTHRALERIRAAAKRSPFSVTARPVADADRPDDPLGEEFDWRGPVPSIEYYCEGLRLAPSKGKISIIGGLPGAGKGPLANYLATCFALGLKAFGQWPCRKSRTFLFDCEGMALTAERISRMTKALGKKPSELHGKLSLRDASGLALLTPGFFERLEEAEPEIVFLDSYTSAMMTTDADPNKPEYAKLAHALGQLNCLVVAVAHGRKIPIDQKPTLGDIAGSGALGAMAATGISVYRTNPDDLNTITVACMRSPRNGFAPFDVTFSDTTFDGLRLEMTGASEKAAAAAAGKAETLALAANRILSAMHKAPATPMSRREISERVGGNRAMAYDAVAALERANMVECQAGSRGLVYVLLGDAPRTVTVTASGDVEADEVQPSRFGRAGRKGQ